MEGDAIDLNLIPFGFNPKEEVFHDVYDVPRGKKCGCICPSCKTPLIARHGDVKEWHFAHASRTVFKKTENECKFSFYVSVRMMARQIVGERLEMILPAYNGCVSEYVESYSESISVPFIVTEQQKIILSNVKVEQNLMGVPVDISGQVGTFSFIIYFTHPSRDIPETLYNPADTKCGVVSVSLGRISAVFAESRRNNGVSYQDILRDFLVNDIESKKWVFHPRYRHCEEEAKHKLKERKSQLKQPHIVRRKELPDLLDTKIKTVLSSGDALVARASKKLASYQCVICHTVWQGAEHGGGVCPKCKTHLYSRMLGYVENKT